MGCLLTAGRVFCVVINILFLVSILLHVFGRNILGGLTWNITYCILREMFLGIWIHSCNRVHVFPTGITRGTDIKIKKNRGQVSYSCYTIAQWEQCVYLISALIGRFFEYVYQAHTRIYMSEEADLSSRSWNLYSTLTPRSSNQNAVFIGYDDFMECCSFFV